MTLLLMVVALLLRPGAPASAQSACTEPQYRAFDFWVGDWDVVDFKDPAQVVARARVEILLDRCVIHEVYDGANGLKGQSFSIYDASHGVWHQSWVTNRGQLLLLDGGMQGDRMVLTGTQRARDGTDQLLRGEWARSEGGIREVAQTSSDGGKTWQPLFDLVFRRR